VVRSPSRGPPSHDLAESPHQLAHREHVTGIDGDRGDRAVPGASVLTHTTEARESRAEQGFSFSGSWRITSPWSPPPALFERFSLLAPGVGVSKTRPRCARGSTASPCRRGQSRRRDLAGKGHRDANSFREEREGGQLGRYPRLARSRPSPGLRTDARPVVQGPSTCRWTPQAAAIRDAAALGRSGPWIRSLEHNSPLRDTRYASPTGGEIRSLINDLDTPPPHDIPPLSTRPAQS